MPTPVARSPLNVFEGASPDDVNQLLGTHAPVVVYTNNTALIGPTTPPSFSQFFPLSDAAGSYAVDQEFTMNGTVLDRVVLPVSIAAGLGNDLLVGLYADSVGFPTDPTGPPLAATFVPKEFLQPSPCADFNGVMLSPWQAGAPNTTLPANLAGIFAQSFIDDGAANIFSIGGWDGATPVNYVVSAPFDGTGLGAWSQTAPLPVALSNVGTAYSNGSIIVAGGLHAVSTPVNTVYTAQAGADGTVATWTTQTALPVALSGVAVAVIGNTNVYAVGGLTAGGTYVSTVYSAPLATGGTIGAWTTPAASQLPMGLYGLGLVQVEGWLVAIGGTTTGPTNVYTVYAAPINTTTNTIGSWQPWPALPVAAGANPNVWVSNGNIIVSTTTVHCSSLAVNAGGPANTWVSQPILTSYGYGNSTVVNGTLITIGYDGPGGTALVNSVPTISVPLHATGLTNTGKYHICVQPVDAYSQVNVTQMALTQVKPDTAWYGAAQEGTLTSGIVTNYINADLLSGVSWNTNSVNCSVTTPVEYGYQLYNFVATTNGGGYSFSTPVGAAGVAVTAGTVVTYALRPLTSGTPQQLTAVINWYTSAGAFISSSTVQTCTTDGTHDATDNPTAPATTAFATLAVTMSGGNAGDTTSCNVQWYTAASSYVPMSLYKSGTNLKPMHVLDDIVNLQPNGWSSIAYDYAGKPVQYGESLLPLVNLLAPNTSNFGGVPTGGTTAGWPFVNNCSLAIASTTPPLPATVLNSSLSPVGAPAFPIVNPLLLATFLELTSIASGDMTVWSAYGTSGVPVKVGQNYTAFAYFANGGTNRNCSVIINWWKSDGTACAHAADDGAAVMNNVNYWVQAYVNAVAPATAAFATVIVKVAATGAGGEVHVMTCAQLALDNSLQSGKSTPQLAYFDPQSGPGGTRTFLQLVYDAATSQFIGVTDISATAPSFFGTGATATYGVTVDGTLNNYLTDTQAQWPMNGLVGATVSVPSDVLNAGNAANTTATVLFNTATTVVLSAWSNGSPSNGSPYSITPA